MVSDFTESGERMYKLSNQFKKRAVQSPTDANKEKRWWLWRRRTPSNPISEEVGITEQNGRFLQGLLCHYDHIVYLGMVFWRKMLILLDDLGSYGTTSYGPERVRPEWLYPPLKHTQAHLTKPEHFGIMGALNKLELFLPPVFLAERRPLTRKGLNDLSMSSEVPGQKNRLQLQHSFSRFFAWAIRDNQLDVVQLMLTNLQVELNRSWSLDELDTPLEMAVQAGRPRMVRLLVKQGGADVHPLHSWDRRTLLHETIQAPGSLGGGYCDMQNQETALEIVRALCECGIDVNRPSEEPSDNQGTALHLVAGCQIERLSRGKKGGRHSDNFKRKVEGEVDRHCALVAEILLSSGAQVDPLNEDGETPARCAVVRQRPLTLQQLLAGGANINYSNELLHDQATLLHTACAQGSEPVVEVLLHHGTQSGNKLNINATDYNNNTPLDLVPRDRPDLMELLVRHGGDVREDCEWWTEEDEEEE